MGTSCRDARDGCCFWGSGPHCRPSVLFVPQERAGGSKPDLIVHPSDTREGSYPAGSAITRRSRARWVASIKKAAWRCPVTGGELGCVAAAPGGMAAPIGYAAGGRSASRADQEG